MHQRELSPTIYGTFPFAIDETLARIREALQEADVEIIDELDLSSLLDGERAYKVLVEDYRGHYNHHRPHSALGCPRRRMRYAPIAPVPTSSTAAGKSNEPSPGPPVLGISIILPISITKAGRSRITTREKERIAPPLR